MFFKNHEDKLFPKFTKSSSPKHENIVIPGIPAFP
jgi:hypothetical protein